MNFFNDDLIKCDNRDHPLFVSCKNSNSMVKLKFCAINFFQVKVKTRKWIQINIFAPKI